MPELWQCNISGCDYETESERGLSIHKSRSHNGSASAKKTYTCAECGDTFEDYPSRREGRGRTVFFCSRDCKYDYESHGTIERDCANCETTLTLPEHRLEDSTDGYSIDNHFCDKECESEWKGSNWTGENHPSHQGKVATFCEECGQIYESIPSEVEQSRFCSWSCKQDAWADDPLELLCPICETEFSIQPHRKHSETPTCSDECYRELLSELRMGEKNPAWKGGSIGPYSGAWDRVREDAIERANGACVLCGCTTEQSNEQYGRGLHGHHVTPVRSFDDISEAHEKSEVMALCLPCHRKAEQYAPLRPRIDMIAG